jgi:hypothetical protein
MEVTKEYNETIRANFEWLRKQEYFSKEDIGRISNMSTQYLGKAVGCHSCGGGLHKVKWDLVGFMDQTIQMIDKGLITIKTEELLISEPSTKTLLTDNEVKTERVCIKCGKKLSIYASPKRVICTACEKFK